MNECNGRRNSMENNKLKNRASESSFRIHLQSTKAICRNKSITTTDSLKLYEDQIVIKNPILDNINESSLQKRPLSLCFDLGSSGEEINTTDTSSTMSSMSSSSSSSTNSKSYNSNESDPFLDDDNYKGTRHSFLCDEYNVDSDTYCMSNESSAKESIITVINNKICKPIELLNLTENNNQICVNEENNIQKERSQSLSLEQHYDLSSSDNIEDIKMDILENEIAYVNPFDLATLSKILDISEIVKIFNLNSLGMKLMQDEINKSLICTTKIFINLCEPVRMNVPNADIEMCKTLFPRGGYELVNIDRASTCKDIIEHLFDKFHIQESYSNYGLFEHTIQIDQKVVVKRLSYDHYILGYLVDMVRIERDNFPVVIHSKRFVLQENEKVQIKWSKFSKSELWNFLRILEKEEKDRKQKIIKFYTELETMIKYQMNLINN